MATFSKFSTDTVVTLLGDETKAMSHIGAARVMDAQLRQMVGFQKIPFYRLHNRMHDETTVDGLFANGKTFITIRSPLVKKKEERPIPVSTGDVIYPWIWGYNEEEEDWYYIVFDWDMVPMRSYKHDDPKVKEWFLVEATAGYAFSTNVHDTFTAPNATAVTCEHGSWVRKQGFEGYTDSHNDVWSNSAYSPNGNYEYRNGTYYSVELSGSCSAGGCPQGRYADNANYVQTERNNNVKAGHFAGNGVGLLALAWDESDISYANQGLEQTYEYNELGGVCLLQSELAFGYNSHIDNWAFTLQYNGAAVSAAITGGRWRSQPTWTGTNPNAFTDGVTGNDIKACLPIIYSRKNQTDDPTLTEYYMESDVTYDCFLYGLAYGPRTSYNNTTVNAVAARYGYVCNGVQREVEYSMGTSILGLTCYHEYPQIGLLKIK